ncbi:MAG TPA: ZmpA/ZmpB/ZmpC family metallo-endopeptidase-related protein [Oscillospiraceae bacterium]|nr:ZmpA/ZmpB/ZmpC family metallo-endopeptidase-related protein [Oscillospiraceae bacterium]
MKKTLALILFVVLSIPILTSCTVGSAALFTHPADMGYEYSVIYNAMGGTINTLEKRSAFYAEDSLIYEPQGSAGMLVTPKKGSKVLVGWFTAYEEDADGTIHVKPEDQWDFDTDRISKELAIPLQNTSDSENEQYVINLYAYWIESPTIEFVDADNHDEVLLKWNPTIGKPIERPTTTEPKKFGYTLLDYYLDEETTEKVTWGGDGISIDEIVEGTAESSTITVYCKFIEGDYTRVRSISELEKIKDNLSGSYILANDLDFDGRKWENALKEFTGTLLGNGYTISNMTINALNRAAGVSAIQNKEVSFGLFSTLNAAKISDLNFKDITLQIDSKSNSAIAIGALAGRTKSSTITNCTVDGLELKSTAPSNVDVTAAALAVTDNSNNLSDIIIEGTTSDGLDTTGTTLVDLTK